MWVAAVCVAVLALLVVGALFVFGGDRGASAQPVPPDGTKTPAASDTNYAKGTSAQATAGKPDLKLLGTVEGIAVRHVRYQQTVNGIPVEGAFVTEHVDKQTDATLYWTNRSVTVPAQLPDAVPAIAMVDAVSSARAAAGVQVSRGDATTELVYLPEDGRLRLAWKVLVPALEPLGDWLVFLDALDGSVISIHNVIFTDCPSPPTPGGCVFDPNPVTTQGSFAGLTDNGDADSPLLTSLRLPVSLLGITSVGNPLGQLIGEYVNLTAPGIVGGYLPAGVCQEPTHRYNRTRSNDCFEEVMAYFHIDRFQRYIQSLGFSIYARPIPVHAHYMADCNAFYSSSDLGLHFGDGDEPYCVGASVDSAEEGDIILHEYGHALLDEQVPGIYTLEGAAIHEGFADLVAALFYFNANPAWDAACVGEWGLGPNPGCVRRVDGTKHYPEDLVGEPHADGEIWSGAIWEVFQDLGGNVAARDKVTRLLLEGNYYLDPSSGLPDAADGVVSADQALYGGADVPLLEAVFDARGLNPVAPANDDFANRLPITSLPFTHSQSTGAATMEPGEPQPCGLIGSTVWFQYTPPADGTLVADTFGSSYDTVLAAYHGSGWPPSVNDGCNDDSVGLQSQISFPVTAGVTYYFQVGGFSGRTGNLILHVQSGGGGGPILVYTDDYSRWPGGPTVPMQALSNLGYGYTPYYDANFSGFELALATGGPWDLVIFDNEAWYPQASTYTALTNYVNAGGKLIVFGFEQDQTFAPPLNAAMCAQYQSDLGLPPSIYRRQPAHAVFNDPNTVPDITQGVDNYGDDGDYMSALTCGAGIGGAAGTSPNEFLIIVRNDGKSILNSFLPGDYSADQDSDGKQDIVELAENEIEYVMGGPEPETVVVRIGSGSAPTCTVDTVPLDVITPPVSPPLLVGAATVDIQYDPAVVEPTGWAAGSGWDTVLCSLAYGPNKVRCTGIDAQGVTGEVLLADLTFHCIGETGQSSPLDVQVVTLTDPNGNPLPWEDSDGTFSCGLCGDANCSGSPLDAVDALFILQHVVGLRGCSDQCPPPAGTLYCAAANVNGDAGIDAVDALFVLQCVVGLRECDFQCSGP